MVELARRCHGRVLVEAGVQYDVGLARPEGFVFDEIDLEVIQGHDVVVSAMVGICDDEDARLLRHVEQPVSSESNNLVRIRKKTRPGSA